MERHTVPPIRTGALTLLIALTAVCLAVLAVLSFTTAQADLSLAEKSLERFSQDAVLENEGQQWLARLDAALAAGQDAAALGQTGEGGAITVTLTGEEGRTLTIAALPTPQGPGRYTLTRWQYGQQRDFDTGPQLWDGSF
ncbi:hypothetical protein [Allofournierella massiliensis]|uniref:Uncharacterized protein n=1 Tax=Allofournierella massiliensis TaxID=1650663 RepID=A0A4R1QJX9_9FIRM|nr:hypothetical protein [Fournierella massiliensis]TCL53866.1 hypothetical protein EDD77_12640 [Fournierella massiliensis]